LYEKEFAGEDPMADHNEHRPQHYTHTQGAIDMLQADHRTVRTLFRHYQDTNDQPMKRQIAERIFVELEIHAQLEARVFYPAFAGAGDVGEQGLVTEAHHKHQTMQDLMTALRTEQDEEAFAEGFHELMIDVAHHAHEEETEIFPTAQKILADADADLCAAMHALKQQLLTC
jgi:hemerythrin superfamily protein